MSIRIDCPNGHHLQAKESLAGKVCLCPKCKARVRVPEMVASQSRPVTESAVMDFIGGVETVRPTSQASVDTETAGPAKPKTHANKVAKKTCPHCEREIPAGNHICPNCRRYIAALQDF